MKYALAILALLLLSIIIGNANPASAAMDTYIYFDECGRCG